MHTTYLWVPTNAQNTNDLTYNWKEASEINF